MTPRSFVSALAGMQLPNVFNPWADRCAIHDRADAPQRRRANLISMLDAAIETRVETVWIARDLGYRGGRRTGVPLTDEVHLDDASRLLGDVSFVKATTGPAVAERTAAIVWRMLTRVNEPVMLWNVFPFHPHDANDPMSNRCHSRLEREMTWPLLEALIEMLEPRQIIAIGRDAHLALEPLPLPIHQVRHPSYGGQADFIRGIFDIYGVADESASDRPMRQLSFA